MTILKEIYSSTNMQNSELLKKNVTPSSESTTKVSYLRCFQAFLVQKSKRISPKIHRRRFQVDWMSFTRFIQHRVQNLYKGKLQLPIKWERKLAMCYLLLDILLPHPFSDPHLKPISFRFTYYLWRWKSFLLQYIFGEISLHWGTRNSQ